MRDCMGRRCGGAFIDMSKADLTSPAMSTISRNAGTSLFGWNRSHSHLNLSSGMFTRACRGTSNYGSVKHCSAAIRCLGSN